MPNPSPARRPQSTWEVRAALRHAAQRWELRVRVVDSRLSDILTARVEALERRAEGPVTPAARVTSALLVYAHKNLETFRKFIVCRQEYVAAQLALSPFDPSLTEAVVGIARAGLTEVREALDLGDVILRDIRLLCFGQSLSEIRLPVYPWTAEDREDHAARVGDGTAACQSSPVSDRPGTRPSSASPGPSSSGSRSRHTSGSGALLSAMGLS